MLDTTDNYKEFSNYQTISAKDPVIRTFIDLSNNKKVEDDNLFIIEGLWAYEKLMKSKAIIEAFVFCPEFIKSDTMKSLVYSFIGRAKSTYIISAKTCARISGQDKSEGFFLLCRMEAYSLSDISLGSDNIIVILDGVEQAGNVGTIIRTVDGAGGDAVILCNSRIRKNSHKLIKSSMGASFILPIIQEDIEETIAWLNENNFQMVLTDLTAEENYFNIDYSGRIAIVVGNEIHGISDIWRSQKCKKVIIPMLGGADSLNVGIATSLVVYEASMRQKGYIKRI